MKNSTKIISSALVATSLGVAAETTTPKQPNIVLVMVDQMRFDMISNWDTMNIDTPNLDMLVKTGNTFTNCYTPSPVCGPARAAIFSGMYPNRCGADGNWYPFNGFEFLFSDVVKTGGYQTASMGKLHFLPHKKSWGFDVKRLNDAPYNVYVGQDEYSDYINDLCKKYGKEQGLKMQQMYNEDEFSYNDNLRQFILGRDFIKDEDHQTTWVTNESLKFLKERDTDKPFLLYAGYFGPHHPWRAPANRIKTDPKTVQIPELDYDYSDKPIVKLMKTKEINRNRSLFEKEDYQEIMAHYYDTVMMLDDYIGNIFDELKAQGVWDNTMVIFTADHGEHAGHFGLFFKSTMLESSAKVPMIIKFPNQTEPKVIDTPVSNIDIYGTILEVSGNMDKRLEYIDAGSLVDVKNASPCFSKLGNLSMLREGDFKLVRFDSKNDGILYEFYKLEPNKLDGKNLYGSGEYKDIQEDLTKKLADILTRQEPPKKNFWHKPSFYK